MPTTSTFYGSAPSSVPGSALVADPANTRVAETPTWKVRILLLPSCSSLTQLGSECHWSTLVRGTTVTDTVTGTQ